MDYVRIRKQTHLTQEEFALLIGIPVGTLRNWEQTRREPDSSTIMLYRLVSKNDEHVATALVSLAAEKRYDTLEEVKIFRSVVKKLVKSEIVRGLLDLILLQSNPQWRPEELGFRITRYS